MNSNSQNKNFSWIQDAYDEHNLNVKNQGNKV